MLVDLGRNDLGRVCRARHASSVVEFGAVERYSHVMHIVSDGRRRVAAGLHRLRRAGRLLPGRDAVRRAQGPRDGDHRRARAGPPRHLRRRVGYLDFAGDLDMAIAIRTAVVRDGVAYVQAGARHRRRLRPGG